MTVKCYYKPTRSTPRLFTPKDLARIACRLKSQGISDEQILAASLECLDIDLCSALTALVSILALLKTLAEIFAVMKLKELADWLLKVKTAVEALEEAEAVVNRSLVGRILAFFTVGRLRIIAAVIIILTTNASALEKAIESLTTNIETIELLLNVLRKLCPAAGENS